MKKDTSLPKQTFEVWHISNPELITEGYFYPDGCIARWLNNYENYIMVAEVAASNLEEVVDITQNGKDIWTKSPHVLWRKSHDLRSTAVGDVLVHNGKAWLVTWRGFTKIIKH
jgi:hypothetical protein